MNLVTPPPLPPTWNAGDEPLPGYRLLSPLGRGGFGQVWRCEAPGGLLKAIKLVPVLPGPSAESDSPAEQEFRALQLVKSVRHPFVLSLDRVEMLSGVLLIVMELADVNLGDIQADHRRRGLPGVPRELLLGYLREAADALDWMNFEHGLQHGDVKPVNLFVAGNHVKVADFGLVHCLGDGPAEAPARPGCGLSPPYAAPEVWRGTVSRHSDQYSLAIVYQQLLTGTAPFPGKNGRQLMVQHLTGEPDLAALPEADRPAVARALAKVPHQRFPSCQDFVRALLQAGPSSGEVVLAAPVADPVPQELSDTDRGDPARKTTADPPEPRDFPAGCRPLQFLGLGPLGALWRVEDAQGQERYALQPKGRGRGRPAFTRLQELRHPNLVEVTVQWGPAGRPMLLSDCCGRALRDRFDECRAAGARGILREELLGYLRTAAETLDALAEAHGLQHLGLNPQRLLLDRGRVALADFGLVPLLWLPTGRSAADLNARYAAPELFAGLPARTSDQYSLALIYLEMLLGVQPRARRRGPGTGPPAGEPVDLAAVPAAERPALARALRADPAERFPTCAEFVRALEAAGRGPAADAGSLPAIVPVARLTGGPPPAGALPTVAQFLAELAATATGPVAVHGAQSLRYAVYPDGSWEYRCPVRLFHGALQLKVEDFAQQWGARVLHADDGCRLEINLSGTRRLWEFGLGRQPLLVIDLTVRPLLGPDRGLSEACARVRAVGRGSAADRGLALVGPRVLSSLRSYLLSAPEQRADPRWPCPAPVRVYPAPAGAAGEPIDGAGENLSSRGVSFLVPRPPTSDRVYLHWHDRPLVADFAVLAQVVRVRPVGDRYEVGATFPGGPAPAD